MTETQPFRAILIPLSLSDTDSELLQHAAFLGGILKPDECHFVHVCRECDPNVFDERMRALARAATAQALPASARYVFQVYQGPVEDHLLRHAREHHIDLILMGHQRAHSRRRALGRRLAMHAPCSVWVVPEGSRPELRRILVPVDFSENSADALLVAGVLARRAGLDRIAVLHVRFNAATVTFENYEEIEEGEQRRAMDEFLAPIDLKGLEVDMLFEEAAHVSTAVDRVAEREQLDLIVMNTRGRSTAAAVLLGSETEQVFVETERPVLVVKHRGARLSVLDALLERQLADPGVRFG